MASNGTWWRQTLGRRESEKIMCRVNERMVSFFFTATRRKPVTPFLRLDTYRTDGP